MESIVSTPPKSVQAATAIKAEIVKMGLKPGDRILTARQFAEKLTVSKQVIQSAFAILEKEGVVETRSRYGTFITTPKKHALGMLLHAKSDAYALMLVKAINETTTKLGVNLRTSSFSDFSHNALKATTALAEDGSEAVIIPWLPLSEKDLVKTFAPKCSMPLVMLPMIEGLEKHCPEAKGLAGIGSTNMTQAACEYFRLLGASRIAFLGPRMENTTEHNLQAFSTYVTEHGLENSVAQIPCDDQEMAALVTQWRHFKGNLSIICHDDVYAIKAMRAFHRDGWTAPGDFRIIGRNDAPQAAVADPPLSSFRINYNNLATITVKCALAGIRGEEWHSTVPAPNMLEIRESCGGAGRITPGIIEAIHKFSRGLVEIANETKNNC